MTQTWPNFVLMLRFYHNFSITCPKKISCKIFAMLTKMQCIFIILHYLDSHYWTKMSHTFTFNRMELVPICQNKPWLFHDRLVSIGLWPPQSPDLTPLDFFLWGHLKDKICATPSATIEELKRRVLPLKFRRLLRWRCERFSKIWCAALLHVKISMDAFSAYVMVYKSYFR